MGEKEREGKRKGEGERESGGERGSDRGSEREKGRGRDGGRGETKVIIVAAVWLAFIIFNSWFDRWAVLGGSGAASSGHFRPILGGPGGSGPELNIYF